MSQLKPCPFCGVQPVDSDHTGGWVHGSAGERCCAEGIEIFPEDRDAELWNRRAPVTVAEALTVPEVRALVEWALRWHELDARNGPTGGSCLSGLLAAMKGGQR